MPLTPGERLGPYEIVAPIGAGGMGEVYRARDTRLDRTVAIKISHQNFSERFEREARSIAALNHPNICQLYDVGPNYLVMEYVEGAPIAGGGGLRKLLDAAAQIAGGLAAAHAAGVVHRDLKPDNILVTADGKVKILDFGLAKQTASRVAADATQTALMGATDPGTILGTVFYMSPEQARAMALDARSDQFSFGLILYELAGGKRAFVRDSTAQTLAAIIEAEPDYSALAATPPAFRWIVERCLAKDPRDRYDSTGDLARDLEQLRRHQSELSMSTAPVDVAQPRVRRGRWIPIAAAVALLAGLAGWFGRGLATAPPTRFRYTPVVVDSASATTPAWSPDGKALAYAQESGGYYQIFTRRLDQHAEAPAQLTSLEEDCLFPFWHPGGDRIYFLTDAGLWSVGSAGGQPEKIVANAVAAAISPDGKTLVAHLPVKDKVAIWSAGPDGRNAVRVMELPSPGVGHPTLAFSPDGRRIAATRYNSRETGFMPFPFRGSSALETIHFPLPPDSFIYSLYWLPDSRHFISEVTSGFSSFGLWRGDADAKTMEPLSTSEIPEGSPAVSPDGSRIAYAAFTLNWDVLLVDFATRAVKPLVNSARYDGWPAWTPSGEQLVFTTNRRGVPELWLTSLREGWERPLLTPADFDDPTLLLAQPAVSPNGRSLVMQRYTQSGVGLFMVPFTGGKPVELAANAHSRKDHPVWSPDGNWVAFAIGSELRKVRAGSGDDPILLRNDLATKASVTSGAVRWSRPGELLYLSADGLTVTDANGAQVHVVTRDHLISWDWSPDGKTIFAIREQTGRALELISIDPQSGQSRVVAPLGRRPVTPEPLGYADTIRQLAVAPDGKSAVFAYLKPDSQIWMMEQVKDR
jgi:Tol biopolymer transport system component/predicted Ser/Thr protein kinase